MNMALDPSVRDAAVWALVHSLWEFVVVSLAAAAASACMRDSARLRYAVCLGALLLMPVLLVGTAAHFLRGTSLPGAAEVVVAGEPPVIPVATTGYPQMSDPAPALPVAAAASSWQSRIDAHTSVILAVYLAGAALCLLRLALGSGYLLRLRRGAGPAEARLQASADGLAVALGVRRRVRILESARVDSPSVVGMLRPVVLIPACAVTGMTVEELEALLAHELAHIRRGDHMANMVQNVLEAVLFYHPAAWWLSARVRQEREHCCDDIAVAFTGDRAGYARALTAMESLRPVHPALALGARGGKLLPRIRRVLGLRATGRRSLATRTLLFTTAGVSLLLTAVSLYTGCSTAHPPAPALASVATQVAPYVEQIRVEKQAYILSSAQLDKIAPSFEAPKDSSLSGAMSASILDNDQVTELLKTIQAYSVAAVTLPSVLLANGQNAAVAPDAASFHTVPAADRPLLEHVPESLEATGSANGRYVVLQLFERGSSGKSARPKTMVSIPDGGTLLLFRKDAAIDRGLLLLIRPKILSAPGPIDLDEVFARAHDFSANGLSLEAALNQLQEQLIVPGGHLGIVPDWPSIEAAGIKRSRPIMLDLHNASGRVILSAILDAAGKGTLVSTVRENMTIVSTATAIKAGQFTYIGVYDVRDLLYFFRTSQTSGPPPMIESNDAPRPAAASQPAAIEQLVGKITAAVAPDSWKVPGHSIRSLNGQLIVSQSDQNQAAIQSYLQQLREKLPDQISMKVDVFLADEPTHGAILKQFNHRLRPAQAGGPVAREGLASVLTPEAAGELAALLAAAQDTPHLDTKAITLLNLQSGLISNTRQLNFIDRVDPPATPDAKPLMHVATLNTGMVLQIQPLLFSETRPAPLLHVMLSLRQFLGINTFSSDPHGPNLMIMQVPRVAETRIDTAMLTADHHTLLLGGESVTGDVRIGDKEIHLAAPHYLYVSVTPTVLPRRGAGSP
jgi:beta-lactamase regulating signal transducer with metallopeptidase domain